MVPVKGVEYKRQSVNLCGFPERSRIPKNKLVKARVKSRIRYRNTTETQRLEAAINMEGLANDGRLRALWRKVMLCV